MPFTKDGRWIPINQEESKKRKNQMFKSFQDFDEDEDRPSYEPEGYRFNDFKWFDDDYAYQMDKTIKEGLRERGNDGKIKLEREPLRSAEPAAPEVNEEVNRRREERGFNFLDTARNIARNTQGPLLSAALDLFGPRRREEEVEREPVNTRITENSMLNNRAPEGKLRGIYEPETREPADNEPGSITDRLNDFNNLIQRPLDKLSDALTFGGTKALRKKMGIDQGEANTFSEQVADKIGEGLSFGVGGGAVRGAAQAFGRSAAGQGLAQRGREILGRNMPSPRPQTSPSLSQTLAGIGAGGLALEGANDFVEGWTDPEIEERSAMQQVASSMRAGFYDNISSIGSAANWLGNEKLGEKIKGFAENQSEGFEGEYSKEFSWRSFLDPEYYQTTVARSLPSVFMTMPLGIIGYGAGVGVAGKLGLGAFGRTVAGSIGGTAFSAPIESAMIAGGTYEEALKRGHDEETANGMASESFWKSLAVSAVTQAPELAAMFTPVRRYMPQVQSQLADLGVRTAAAGSLEGAQEVGQEWAVTSSLGDELDPAQAAESFGLGFLMGGAFGAAGAISDPGDYSPYRTEQAEAENSVEEPVVNAPNPLPGENSVVDPNNPVVRIQRRAKEIMPEEMRVEFEDQIEGYVQNGYAPDIAEVMAWEAVALTPQGKDLINRATRETVGNIAENQGPVQTVRQTSEYDEAAGPQQYTRPTSTGPIQGVRQVSDFEGEAGPKQPAPAGQLVRVQGEPGVFRAEEYTSGKKQTIIDADGNKRYIRPERLEPADLQPGDTITVQGREGNFTVTDMRGDDKNIQAVDDQGNTFYFSKSRITPSLANPVQFGPREVEMLPEVPEVPETITEPSEGLIEPVEDTEIIDTEESDMPEEDQRINEQLIAEREARSFGFEGAREAKDYLRNKETFEPTHRRSSSGKLVEAVTFTDNNGTEQVVFAGENERPTGPVTMNSFLQYSEPLETAEDVDLDPVVSETTDQSIEEQWQEIKRDIAGLGRLTPANRVARLESAIEFAEANGLEYPADRWNSLIDRFRAEAEEQANQKSQKDQEPSESTRKRKEKDFNEGVQAEIERQRNISTLEEATQEFIRRINTNNTFNRQVDSILEENPDINGDQLFSEVEPRLAYMAMDVLELLEANSESEANRFLEATRDGNLIRQSFNDYWQQRQNEATSTEESEITADQQDTGPIKGSSLNNVEDIEVGDYVIAGSVNIPSRVTSVDPLEVSNTIRIDDNDRLIHLRNVDDIPENIANLPNTNDRFLLVIDHMLDRLNLRQDFDNKKPSEVNNLLKEYLPNYGGKTGDFYFFAVEEAAKAARIMIGVIDGERFIETHEMPIREIRKFYEENRDRIDNVRNKAETAERTEQPRLRIQEDETGFLLQFSDGVELGEFTGRLHRMNAREQFQWGVGYSERQIGIERNEASESFIEEIRDEFGLNDETSVNEEIAEQIEEINENENFKMPWEMSLDEFMKDDSWKAVHANNKDSKQAHFMLMPNGVNFPGGWTATGASATSAKRSFHEEQIYWRLRRNASEVSTEAVKAYPNLKQDLENYRKVLNSITVTDDTVSIKVDDETKDINIEDIPNDYVGRVGLFDNKEDFPLKELGIRSFVDELDLIGKERSNWKTGRWNIREVVGTSIWQKLDEHIKNRFNEGDKVRVPVVDGSFQQGEIENISNGVITVKTPEVSNRDTGTYAFNLPELLSYQTETADNPILEDTEERAKERTNKEPEISENIRSLGDKTAVVTSRGTHIDVQYAVVEAASLITSNNEDGTVNELYPENLQPRERTRKASQDQIARLAGKLNPELLGANILASDGAPIIGPDVVVESGNGRAIALKTVYSNDDYNKQRSGYMRWLIDNAAEFGIDPDDLELMHNPVLVRLRRSDVDREKFTKEANEASVSAMSATEQAVEDANQISGTLMNLFAPNDDGELNNSNNRPFITAFMNDIVAPNERNRLLTQNGYLSQDGLNRVRNAIFARAYGDPRAIATMAETTDNNVRNIVNSMLIAAPRVAYTRDQIEQGNLYDLNLSDDIVAAMNVLNELRASNTPVDQFLQQLGLFGDELSPIGKELLRLFDTHKRSVKKLSSILLEYHRGIEILGDPKQESLFGNDTPTREQLLDISIRRVLGDDNLQTSLFETEEEQNLFPDGPADSQNEQGDQEGSAADPDEESPAEVIQPLPDQPGDVDQEHFQAYVERTSTLIDTYVSAIESDSLPSGRNAQRNLRSMANDIFGRESQEDEWRDALEAAVQIVMSRRVKDNMTLQERVAAAQELEQLMKTSARSLEQMERQQYSTPLPLAQIAAFALDPKANDVVKEGSAGTGSLILPVDGKVSQVKAIELSPRRAAILQKIAAEMETDLTIRNSSTFDYKPKATAVIGNPPFKGQNKGGRTKELSGKAPWGSWGDLGNRFLYWDLNRSLQNGGRLVYIVSPGVIDNAQNSPFRQWLKENHTVRALLKFPAGVYDTRGTKFGAGLIVVDKGKVSDVEPITGEPETLDELVNMLKPLRGDATHGRTEMEPISSTEGNSSGNQGSGPNAEVGGSTTGGSGSSGQTTRGNDGDGVEQPSSTTTGTTDGSRRGRPRKSQAESDGNGSRTATTNDEGQSNIPEEIPQGTRNDKSDELSTIPENSKAVGQALDNLPSVTGYVPKRRVSNAEHPGRVIEAPGMQFVDMPEDVFTDNKYLPHPKVYEGGEYTLSDVQIEAVMAAKYNFLEHDKRGILIADDTGMGKTAELLGIAADNWHSGRTPRILIVTVKDQVANSNFFPENEKFNFGLPITHVSKAYSDERFGNFKDKKFKEEPDNWKPLDIGDGVVLMSQYTFRDSQEAVKKWLNDTDGDVLVLVDESHTFKNTDSKVGLAMKDLFKIYQDKAQFVYASATAAEELDGLEHLYGLKVWGPESFNEFQAKLTGMDAGSLSGGKQNQFAKSMNKKSPFARDVPLTMMEQITRELKMNGQYIGRQLSMEGVTMEGKRIALSNKDKGDWNRAVQFIQMIAEKAEEHGRKPTDRGRIIGSVVGYMRRLRGYYALKGIIEDIKQQQKSGNFKRFAISGFYVSADEGEPATLQSAINVINDTSKVKDSSGETIVVEIPEAVEDKADLMAILQGLDPEWGENPVPQIPSPIEMLYQAFGEDNVVAIHGGVKDKDRPKFVKQFQDGEKPIIWFNSAGGTGVNMHDTIGERIRFYHQDYPYAAKDAKQAEGRVHRTRQKTVPNFVYPYLDSSVDTKFVGTLMARYESMGALSRGDTAKLGGAELSNFDFTGKAAEMAAYRIIPLLDPDVRARMFGNWTRDLFNEPGSELDDTTIRSVYGGKVEVKKFMNALMFLDFDEGNNVFNQFIDVVEMAKQELEANGGMVDKFTTYDGVQTDLQEGSGGIRLRTIETKLKPEQEKALKTRLRVAKQQVTDAETRLENAREVSLEQAQVRLEEIQRKQNEEQADSERLTEQLRELMNTSIAERDGEKIRKVRERRDKLVDSIRKREARIREQEERITGIKESRSDIVDKLPDLRRAQVYLDAAQMRVLSAESEIERSGEIMLVDGRIATNGLLVPIRKAIRKAADKHFKGVTPSSALQLELRGYYLENGQRVVGAVVPKWAEGEVAAALEVRMRYTGKKDDIAKLKAHIQAGNPVALENGFEIRWAPKLEQFQIWGMKPTQHRQLFEQLVGDKRSPDIGYETRTRSFVIKKDEGFRKLIDRFGIAADTDSDLNVEVTDKGRVNLSLEAPETPRRKTSDYVEPTGRYNLSENTSDPKWVKVSPAVARKVADDLATSLDTIFRQNKTPRRTILGQYSPTEKGGRIRREQGANARVTIHEIGHAFSDKFRKNFDFTGDDQELLDVAAKYYPGKLPPTKAGKIEEGLAEFFTLYVTDPETAESEAPKTYKHLEKFLSREEKEIRRVGNVIEKARRLIAMEEKGSAFNKGMGSIYTEKWRDRRPYSNFGQEYQTNWFNRFITAVFDFTIPWRDMYNAAKENGFEGTDFTKLMAIGGAAKEKARRDFLGRATDFRNRYLINYKTTDEVPEFLHPKLNEYVQKYGTVDKALQEINNRSFQTIITESMEHIESRLKTVTDEQLKSMSTNRKELKKHGSFEIWSTVAQAYRYNERAERGFQNNPIDKETAQQIIEDSRVLFPDLENLIREYTSNLSTIILEKLRRAGVIQAEDQQRIMAGSNFYIPTYYATENVRVDSGGGGGRTAGKAVKRYRGSQDMVHDALTATILKLTEVEQSIETKRIINHIESAVRNGGLARFATFVEEDKVPILVSGNQIVNQIDDVLEDPIAEEAIGDKVFQVFVPGGIDKKRSQPIIMNWHGNKRVYIQLAPDLFNTFLSMRPSEIPPYIRFIAKLTSVVRHTSTTLNIRYHINALVRDFFTAGIQTDTTKKRHLPVHALTMVKRTIEGALLATGKGGEEAQRIADAYVTSGAFMSSAENVLNSMARASVTDGLLPTDFRKVKKSKKGAYFYISNAPGEALQVIEQLQRYPEFEAKVRQLSTEYGIDPQLILDGRTTIPSGQEDLVEKVIVEAGYAASEVTTNFSLHGSLELFKTGTSSVPFLHGTLQGLYRETRQMNAIKDPKRAGASLSRLFVLGVPFSIMTWALMQAFDDDDIPQETRDRYWVIPLGESRLKLTIAKPFSYAIPLNFLERFMDSQWGDSELNQVNKSWFNPIKQAFLEVPLAPPLLTTILDIRANKSWHGGDIVPMGDDNYLPTEQYDPLRTSTLARVFSDIGYWATGGKNTMSPKKVDYFLNNFLGPAGENVNDIVSALIEGVSDRYDQPATKKYVWESEYWQQSIEYLPITGKFLIGPKEGGSHSIDNFYKLADKSSDLNSTAKKWGEEYKKAYKRGEIFTPNVKVTDEMINQVRFKPAFDKYRDILSDLRTSEKEYLRDKDVPNADKTQVSLKVNYYTKVIAHLPYGEVPKPPKQLDITQEEIDSFVSYAETEASKALQREAKSKGGPGENALWLEVIKQHQERKK